jgi:hypothetical protein
MMLRKQSLIKSILDAYIYIYSIMTYVYSIMTYIRSEAVHVKELKIIVLIVKCCLAKRYLSLD